MEFYLSFNNNEESLRLPVLPPTFQVKVDNNNTVININEIGDIKLIGKTGLKEIDIERFFPAQEYSFVEYTDYPPPWECVEMIERWRLSGKPIRLIITDTNINLAMSIDSFTFGEQDGTGDVNYKLSLSEYPFTKNKNQSSKSKEYKQENKRPSKEIPKTYIVKPGDTLSIIAKRATGNSSNYKKIAEKNNIKNPNKISVGQVLIL